MIWNQPMFWVWCFVMYVGGFIALAGGACGENLLAFLIGVALFWFGAHEIRYVFGLI